MKRCRGDAASIAAVSIEGSAKMDESMGMTRTVNSPDALSGLAGIEGMVGVEHGSSGFTRLWRTFMRTRTFIAAALLLLELFVVVTASGGPGWLVLVCSLHLGVCLVMQLRASTVDREQLNQRYWLATIGVDVLVFSLLEHFQQGGISFIPLFALPVLMASILGSLMVALATAASITLFLLGHTWFAAPLLSEMSTSRWLQSALTSTGFFLVALLTYSLAGRLARQEALAQVNQMTMRLQKQVNELVIESISEGVLVVDHSGIVRNANPAAQAMLTADRYAQVAGQQLANHLGWGAINRLVNECFASGQSLQSEVRINVNELMLHKLFVRTRLTSSHGGNNAGLCVLFMEDLREVEARVRTEKLVSMGRMSAAVAHEIRNPLSAIAQANALLDEEVQLPAQKRLTRIISENAQRLARIVDEILNVARVQPNTHQTTQPLLQLDSTVRQIANEWMQQNQAEQVLRMHLHAFETPVHFDTEHLRRLLINLLDNAWRHGSRGHGAIRVITQPFAHRADLIRLSVWSLGPPLEPSVFKHLFEPFFSSESRSSGLGLYICRELCERYGAQIGYQRSRLDQHEGNEFYVIIPAAAQRDRPENQSLAELHTRDATDHGQRPDPSRPPPLSTIF